MSEKTTKFPDQLVGLNSALKKLSEKHSFENVQEVIDSVIALLGVDPKGKWKLFNGSDNKIHSNAGWFMVADGYADKRATYKIADDNKNNRGNE